MVSTDGVSFTHDGTRHGMTVSRDLNVSAY
jgi:hypothetical protein